MSDVKKANETVFYIAVIVGVFNSIAFMVEAHWVAFIFFLLVTGATYAIKPDKTFALVTGIIVSNVFLIVSGIDPKSYEGMSTKKKREMEDEMNEEQLQEEEEQNQINADDEEAVEDEDEGMQNKKEKGGSNVMADLDIDGIMGSNSSLEGLMERQTKLMQNLKDMQPMMAQAKNMLNALPKGFVKKALQQFKPN
jgi:hypothetical protein